MTIKDVIAFAKENPVCGVATIDGDQPRVRAFLSLFFEDDRIYFTTGAVKNVFKQLSGNPKVELLYLAGDFRKMMRVTGAFEIVDDRQKKQRLIEEKEYLKGFKADDPEFVLLRLSHGQARFWTLRDNLNERDIPVIEF